MYQFRTASVGATYSDICVPAAPQARPWSLMVFLLKAVQHEACHRSVQWSLKARSLWPMDERATAQGG